MYDAATPGLSSHVLVVEWLHQSATNRGLTLTNVKTGSPDLGDELDFQVTGAIHQVQFTDNSASTTATVQWNSQTSVGFIQAPNFNGGVRTCWDVSLANTICP